MAFPVRLGGLRYCHGRIRWKRTPQQPSQSNTTPKAQEQKEKRVGHASSRTPEQAPMGVHKHHQSTDKGAWGQGKPISPKMGLPNPHRARAPWAHPPLLANRLLAPVVKRGNVGLRLSQATPQRDACLEPHGSLETPHSSSLSSIAF